jgi:hypothetical protein
MASIKNSPNGTISFLLLDVLRKFYEFPKSGEKGVKLTSPKKIEVKANQIYKSVSFTRTSPKPSSNIKVTQSQQGLQNNINISVNNLIINNTNTQNCKNIFCNFRTSKYISQQLRNIFGQLFTFLKFRQEHYGDQDN